MSDNPTGGEVRSDLLRPWCQAADPPIQSHSPVRPCGRLYPLTREVRYGVLYNFCPRHRSREFVEPVVRRSWWHRLVACFGGAS